MLRRVCIVVLSRANYGRSKSIIDAVHNDLELDLQLIVGASAIDELHGNVSKVIEEDGYPITAKVDILLSSSTPASMATTTGLGIIKLSSIFEVLKPDFVVTIADRYETMATAIAASFLNICLVHVQGGEITGSVDESVRHAITKLSHLHFPSTKEAAENIIRLGEPRNQVFHVGCPAMDPLYGLKPSLESLDMLTGIGSKIDYKKPFYLIVYHPVTTEYGLADDCVDMLISAAEGLNEQIIWLWPNVDAGSDMISKKLRQWRENTEARVRFIKNLPVDDYNNLLALADCAIGNSSSFIREGSILATPAIILGTRQNSREHADNAVFFESSDYVELINEVRAHSKRPVKSSSIYGMGDAGEKIKEILKREIPRIQKRLVFEK